jgi:hypothetical protein
LQNYLAASAGAAAGAAGAGVASAGAAAGAATGSTLTSSFLPHATRARVTKPKAITFFILFSCLYDIKRTHDESVVLFIRQQRLVNIIMIDFNAFSHGQIQSKLWLCETLEPLLPERPHVLVLGTWYSALSFMMLTRNQERYKMITGVDKDPESVEVSNKLLNSWMLGEDAKARTILKDVDKPNSIGSTYNVIINCSCEHMSSNWFDQVDKYQLLCLQTSNMVTDDPTWNITNPNPSMKQFKAKYPMSQILFEGEKVFDYGHLVYSRYMIIGTK